ncbi:MAG TPA: hypothetical protein VH350_17160 [Candidatus Sulfotelmatobacter sp.]|jgi:hypothetical protein|nr:hypothetical protein [Candidatus Sulfotelmatobacter sp.]
MKQALSILVLLCSGHSLVLGQATNGAGPASTPTSSDTTKASPAISVAQENDHRAKILIDQAIEALGGKTYLTIRDREMQGRAYSFHHGRPNGEGALFWGFIEFPDKERVEITKERDIAELYVGNKAWEITYKGPHPIEQKDLDDYLRRRHFSLDTILRTWVNDPRVVLLYEGAAIAAQHPATQVTLINAQNESVTLYFDADSHLPIKKSFSWRDPTDRQRNIEEEVYDDYKPVAGIMAPYNLTRYFNGDMASQRFLHEVTINQGLDQAMFDPNSHYNPNKATGKQSGKR